MHHYPALLPLTLLLPHILPLQHHSALHVGSQAVRHDGHGATPMLLTDVHSLEASTWVLRHTVMPHRLHLMSG